MVDYLSFNSDAKGPILIALQNIGNYASESIFSNPKEFINSENGKLINEFKVVTLSQFYGMLNPKYKTILKSLKLQSEISIMFYDSLPNPEFVWAIQNSEDFVGCTGDDSFSKVISMGKVPFYFALGHKIDFKTSFDSFLKEHQLDEFHKIHSKFVIASNREAESSSNEGPMQLPYFFKCLYYPVKKVFSHTQKNNQNIVTCFDKILKDIDYLALRQEIKCFKKETIPEIRNSYSIFKNILSLLEKQNFRFPASESEEESEMVSMPPRELLALKYFNRFKEFKQLDDLIEIIKLYFTAKLFPENFNFLTSMNASTATFDICTNWKTSSVKRFSVLEDFLNYSFKSHPIDLNNPQNISLLLSVENIGEFNKSFVDNLGILCYWKLK